MLHKRLEGNTGKRSAGEARRGSTTPSWVAIGIAAIALGAGACAQAEQAPAAYRSWKERQLVEDKMETAAEGLATRTAFALPQSILWDLLDDFILVSEEEIYRAIVLYLQKTHNLAEGAGAAPLAAAVNMRERLRGRKVALVLSGGNLSLEQLRVALER